MNNIGRLFILCCLLISTAARGQQSTWDGIGVEGNLWWGKMIRHTPKFTTPIPPASYAFELNFLQQTRGAKDWQIRRRYPLVGVALLYINYGDKDVFGDVIGIYPDIFIPLISSDKMIWNLKAGMGIGYVTKPYSRLPVDNTVNVVIGGKLNNVTMVSSHLAYKISNRLQVQAGLQLCHVSNAALRLPNLGINMWGIHAGIRYFPTTANPQRIQRDLQPLKNRWLVQARGAIGFSESGAPDGPVYANYNAALWAGKRYWSKNKVYAGTEYTYHSGVFARLKDIELYPGEEGKHAYNLALFAGNEFLLGRVGVLFQMGYYLKQYDNQNGRIYQKIGGNYYFYQSEKGIVKEVYASAILKAHAFTAQFAEVGLGLSF